MSQESFEEFLASLKINNILYVGRENEKTLVYANTIDHYQTDPKFVLLGSGTLLVFPYLIRHRDAQTDAYRYCMSQLERNPELLHGDPVAAGKFRFTALIGISITSWKSETLNIKTPEVLYKNIEAALQKHFEDS